MYLRVCRLLERSGCIQLPGTIFVTECFSCSVSLVAARPAAATAATSAPEQPGRQGEGGEREGGREGWREKWSWRQGRWNEVSLFLILTKPSMPESSHLYWTPFEFVSLNTVRCKDDFTYWFIRKTRWQSERKTCSRVKTFPPHCMGLNLRSCNSLLTFPISPTHNFRIVPGQASANGVGVSFGTG